MPTARPGWVGIMVAKLNALVGSLVGSDTPEAVSGTPCASSTPASTTSIHPSFAHSAKDAPMTPSERDCNSCRHHRQAQAIPIGCRTCLEITMTTFSDAGRLPFYEPKDPVDTYHIAPNAFLELDPTHTGSKVFIPAPETKDTNPKEVVGIRKAPLSVVPMNVVAEVGVAMMEGALKYGRHNYRDAGVRESVYFDGTLRHLIAYWEGEDTDPDSGLSHLTKAIASLMVWRDAQMNRHAVDDRPPKSLSFYARLNARAANLCDDAQKRGLSPKHFTEKKEIA